MAKTSTTSRNLQADAFGNQFNGGTLKLFPGTIPANPQTAEGQTELVAISLEADAFPAAITGVLTMTLPATAGVATAAGTATWGRFYTSGAAAIMDVTVTTSGGGGDLIATVVIVAINDTSNITSFTYTIPE